MFRSLLLIMVFFLCATCSSVGAQVSDTFFLQLESGEMIITNPFESQLPHIERPVVRPPEAEPTCADNISLCTNPRECSEQGHYWYNSQCNVEPYQPLPAELEPEEQAYIPKPTIALPKFSISGIIWNSKRPQAIINGQIVEVGDTISEIKITGIHKEGIEGLFDGKPVTIKP